MGTFRVESRLVIGAAEPITPADNADFVEVMSDRLDGFGQDPDVSTTLHGDRRLEARIVQHVTAPSLVDAQQRALTGIQAAIKVLRGTARLSADPDTVETKAERELTPA